MGVCEKMVEWVHINMALASIIGTWLVLYATRRTFTDPIVRTVLMYVCLACMCCLIQFAIVGMVDLSLSVGVTIIFGTIGMLFAFFATRHATKKVKKEEKK